MTSNRSYFLLMLDRLFWSAMAFASFACNCCPSVSQRFHIGPATQSFSSSNGYLLFPHGSTASRPVYHAENAFFHVVHDIVAHLSDNSNEKY